MKNQEIIDQIQKTIEYIIGCPEECRKLSDGCDRVEVGAYKQALNFIKDDLEEIIR